MVGRTEWSDIRGIDFASHRIDSSDALWVVPAEKMKLGADQRQDADYDHYVPLSSVAVDTLRASHRLSGNDLSIFPAITSGLQLIGFSLFDPLVDLAFRSQRSTADAGLSWKLVNLDHLIDLALLDTAAFNHTVQIDQPVL